MHTNLHTHTSPHHTTPTHHITLHYKRTHIPPHHAHTHTIPHVPKHTTHTTPYYTMPAHTTPHTQHKPQPPTHCTYHTNHNPTHTTTPHTPHHTHHTTHTTPHRMVNNNKKSCARPTASPSPRKSQLPPQRFSLQSITVARDIAWQSVLCGLFSAESKWCSSEGEGFVSHIACNCHAIYYISQEWGACTLLIRAQQYSTAIQGVLNTKTKKLTNRYKNKLFSICPLIIVLLPWFLASALLWLAAWLILSFYLSFSAYDHRHTSSLVGGARRYTCRRHSVAQDCRPAVRYYDFFASVQYCSVTSLCL